MVNRILKGIGIGFAVLLGIVLLAVIGANFYLKTDQAQNMIKDRLNGSIPGTVLWDRFDISLLRGRVDLADVRIDGPDGQRIITADQLFVNLGLTGLLQKQIVIEDAMFRNPRIHLAIDKDGNLNLSQAFAEPSDEEPPPPSDTEFPFEIRAENLEVNDGILQFEMAAQSPEERPQSIHLRGINIAVTDANLSGPEGWLNLSVGNGAIDMSGIDTELRKLTLDAGLENGTLDPLALVLETSGPNLSVAGSVSRLFEEPRPDLEIDLAGNLSFIRDMFNLDIALSGPIKVNATVSGAMDNPTVQLAATHGGGALPGIEVAAIALDARMEDQLVTIENLKVDAAPGTLAGRGDINLKPAFTEGLLGGAFDVNAMAYDLTVDTQGLALGRLPWTGDLLAGNVAGTVSLAGTGVTPEAVKANAALDLKGEKIAVRDTMEPTDLTLSAEADMADSNVAFHPITVTTGESNLQATGDYRLYENTIDLALDFTSPNLAQVVAPFGVTVVSGQTQLNARAEGPVMQPAITADLSANRLSYDDITVGNIDLDARLAPSGQVTIDSLRVTNEDSTIVAEGTIDLFDGSFANFNSAMPANLDATLEQVKISDFTTAVPVKGIISGTARLTDTIFNPEAVLDITARDMVYEDTTYGDLTAQLNLSDGNLEIKQISIEKGKSKLGLSGLLKNMNHSPRQAPVRPPASPQYPAGAIVPIADVRLVQQTENDPENGGILSFDQPTLDLEFQDSVVYAEDFTDAASGKLVIDGFIRGPINDISKVSAQLQVTGSDLSAQGQQIGALSADIRLENGIVRLEPVGITNGESNLTVSGTLDPFTGEGFEIKEAPGFDLNINGDPIRISDFIDTMSGQLQVNGQIGGTLNNLDGNITISGEEIDTGVQTIESLRIDTRLDGQRIHLDPAIITLARDNRVRAEGWVSLEQDYRIEVSSDAIELKQIGVLQESDITGGTLSLDLSGSGSFSKPELSGTIRMSDLAVGGKTAPDFNIRLALENRLARINADLGFPADARYHLDSQDFAINAEFSGTELGPYFQIAGLSDLSGQITGSLQASGNAAAPKDSTARLEITRLNLRENQTQLVHTDGFSASFENGRYVVSESHISLLRDGHIDVSGNGNISGNLEFHLDGSIPMKVLPAFVESIPNATGRIDLKADLGGSVNRPEIDGTVTFQQIGMTVPVLEQRLHALTGQVNLTEQAVTIEKITGKLDTGDFSLDGRLALEELQPADIRLQLAARNLPIQVPDMLDLEINSGLTLTGTPADSVLTGTPADSVLAGSITILDGLYYRDVNLSLLERVGDIGRRKRQVAPASELPSIDAPFAKNLKFDIRINYRNPLVLDNNLALLQLKPELRISGTMNQPELTGRAEISEGTVTFRNTEFDVEKGVVDFVNPYRIEPTLDIEARSQVRQWNITLAISGTPDNLEFQLSSNPPESDADILSLLIVGRTASELDEGTGAGPAQTPEQMIAKIVANRLAEDVGATTGLDIEIQYQTEQDTQGPTGITPGSGAEPGSVSGVSPRTTAGTDAEAEETIQVTVGKELSRRLSVRYGVVRRSGIIVQQSTAIYKILENLSVSAYQDTEGTFGGDFRYRMEWR